jgi:hypothetical protein
MENVLHSLTCLRGSHHPQPPSMCGQFLVLRSTDRIPPSPGQLGISDSEPHFLPRARQRNLITSFYGEIFLLDFPFALGKGAKSVLNSPPPASVAGSLPMQCLVVICLLLLSRVNMY